ADEERRLVLLFAHAAPAPPPFRVPRHGGVPGLVVCGLPPCHAPNASIIGRFVKMVEGGKKARPDGRSAGALRPIRMVPGFLPPAEGSCLIEAGSTRVVCTATVQESVPPFMRGQGKGWVTAEYAMLPRSSGERIERERRGPGG